MLCSVVRCSAVQCGAVWCVAVRCRAVSRSVPDGAVWYGMVLRGGVPVTQSPPVQLCVEEPGQSEPPFAGSGSVQERICWQSTVHELQAENPPLTAEVESAPLTAIRVSIMVGCSVCLAAQ